MVDILTDIKVFLMRSNTSTGVSCPGNFLNFGETCLYLAKDIGITWEAALLFCQDLGGHLAVFRDANAYARALGYVKASGIAKTSNVWIGGNDHSVEGSGGG
nr:uncharacterized protein LOC113816217 [Penaeus vannamei]